MNLFAWLITGLLAGGAARRAVGAPKRGCLGTIAIGVLGALIAGTLYRVATGTEMDDFGDLDIGSIFVAFIGACALLLVLEALDRRPRPDRR
jgi:uncharacterized membrane protein YeaQ/YmgE (transglycosylase-associated protein family)